MNALARTHQDFANVLSRIADVPEPTVIIADRHFGTCPFTGMRQDWIKVLVDRKYYRADDRQLALLRNGVAPEDLDLIELDPEEDEE